MKFSINNRHNGKTESPEYSAVKISYLSEEQSL